MDRIPVFKPLIEQEEIHASSEALKIGWLGQGSNVGNFEREVKLFLQAHDRYTVALSTGHAALHLGLLLAGVGPNDEVITPSFNNIADFQAILATGAEPVFCDIDPNTLCIDLRKAEKLITKRTKAIIAMDYDCLLCDHEQLASLAENYPVRILHDAAHSFGSRYNGKMIGSFSDLCMFSFDPVKTLTCIDGGMLVVRSEEEMYRLHAMRLVGMNQPASTMYQNKRAWTYDVESLGFRYHLSNIHAAIGLAQLAKMDRIASSRRAACRYYNEHLREIEEIVLPRTDFQDVTPFLYYIRVDPSKRAPLRDHLAEQGIDTGIHWQPGHWFTLFKNAKRGDLSVTEQVGHEILSLPLHAMMEQHVLERVVTAIKSFYRKSSIPISSLSRSSYLQNLKKEAGSSSQHFSIPVGDPPFARLRFIPTHPETISSSDVSLLSLWRNRYKTSFLTEFTATDDQTRQWLINIVGKDETKSLFMLESLDGEAIGYMGIAYIDWKKGYGEADAVVRGSEAPKGAMSIALSALIHWAKTELGLKKIGVRVRSDNTAIQFYRKLGFQMIKQVPLRRIECDHKITYSEDPAIESSSLTLLYMDYEGSGMGS